MKYKTYTFNEDEISILMMACEEYVEFLKPAKLSDDDHSIPKQARNLATKFKKDFLSFEVTK